MTTAFTTDPDPRKAAEQLAHDARATLIGPPTLAILFATTQYATDLLLPALSDALGNIPLWGGSSSTGVFVSGQWLTGDHGAAALMLLSGRPAAVAIEAVGDHPADSGYAATRRAMMQLDGYPQGLLVIGFPGPEEALLGGVRRAAPAVPVVGGSASDHSPRGDFQQFANGKVARKSFAVAAIGSRGTPNDIGAAFSHGYQPAGKSALVTRSQGRKLIELDQRPAMDVYAQWTDTPRQALAGAAILTFSVTRPILLHTPDGVFAVHPVNGNPDGSIDTGVVLLEGARIELGAGSVESMINEVGNVICAATGPDARHPEGIILSHCGGRALGLQQEIARVPRVVHGAVGNVPWIGWLAFGEQGIDRRQHPMHANLSLSAMALR